MDIWPATPKQKVTTVRFGTELRYGTVGLDFGKKYDTELRTEFLEKVRFGTKIRYYIFCTVPYSFRTPVTHVLHFCFQVLHFSFLPMTLPRQLRSPLTPPVAPHNKITNIVL